MHIIGSALDQRTKKKNNIVSMKVVQYSHCCKMQVIIPECEHFRLAFICSSLSQEIGGIIGDDDKHDKTACLIHLIIVDLMVKS